MAPFPCIATTAIKYPDLASAELNQGVFGSAAQPNRSKQSNILRYKKTPSSHIWLAAKVASVTKKERQLLWAISRHFDFFRVEKNAIFGSRTQAVFFDILHVYQLSYRTHISHFDFLSTHIITLLFWCFLIFVRKRRQTPHQKTRVFLDLKPVFLGR